MTASVLYAPAGHSCTSLAGTSPSSCGSVGLHRGVVGLLTVIGIRPSGPHREGWQELRYGLGDKGPFVTCQAAKSDPTVSPLGGRVRAACLIVEKEFSGLSDFFLFLSHACKKFKSCYGPNRVSRVHPNTTVNS